MIGVLALKVVSATLSVAIPSVSYLGLRYLRRHWKLNLTREEERQLSGLAQQGVVFAEQHYRHWDKGEGVNREKFDAVKQFIAHNAAQRGIRIDEDTLRSLIESIVFEHKRVSGTREEPRPISPEETIIEGQPAPEVLPSAPDDLTRIEGIGPKISKLLQKRGITTFAELAGADVERLRQILSEAKLRASPSTWPEQAKCAAAGQWEALDALQKQLTRGRRADKVGRVQGSEV